MLLGTKKTFYDHITEALLGKPMTVPEIQDFLKSRKVKASVQGVYLTLRELISENIVIKQKKTYLLNSEWLNKLSGEYNFSGYEFGGCGLYEGETACAQFDYRIRFIHWLTKEFEDVTGFFGESENLENYLDVKQRKTDAWMKKVLAGIRT